MTQLTELINKNDTKPGQVIFKFLRYNASDYK